MNYENQTTETKTLWPCHKSIFLKNTMATDDEMEGPYAGMYEYLVNFLLLQTRVIRLVRFIWFHEEVFRNSFESNFSGVMINNQYF